MPSNLTCHLARSLPAPRAMLPRAAEHSGCLARAACDPACPLCPMASCFLPPSRLVLAKNHTAPLLAHGPRKRPFCHPGKQLGCLCSHITSNKRAPVPAEAHHAENHLFQVYLLKKTQHLNLIYRVTGKKFHNIVIIHLYSLLNRISKTVSL